MRRRNLIIGTAACALVISGGVVAGLNAASSGRIADGITIGGVDVGGMTPEAARSHIDALYTSALREPVVFRRRGEEYRFTAKEARTQVDVDRAIAEAVEQSEDKDIFTRAWETAVGSSDTNHIAAPATVSRDAILRYVDRVRRAVDRDAKDAKLTFDGPRPQISKSQAGMTVDRQELRAKVEAALVSPTQRTGVVPVDTKKPKMTVAALRKQAGTVLTVDRSTNKLRLYKQLKLDKTYTVSVGKGGYDTPAGTFTIQNKQVNPTWSVPNSEWAGDLAGQTIPPGPGNPLVARWIGFNGSVGFHGTTALGAIGGPASHGCVRMIPDDVIDLYERVDVGDTVHVF